MSSFVKCLNPNCVNTIERIKKGGHWKKFCNSKCRSQYHSNTSSKFATPTMLGVGSSVSDNIQSTVVSHLNSAVGQVSGNVANRVINQLEGKMNEYGLPLPLYSLGGAALSQVVANLFKVENKDTRLNMAKWFGAIGLGLDFAFHKKPLQEQEVLNSPIVQQKNRLLELTNTVKNGGIVSGTDYRKISIPVIPIKSEYDYLFGMPARDFYMVLHGLPGNGKTTFAVKFAQYFNKHHGKVLYLASEQSGVDLSFQEILKEHKATFNIHTKPRELSEDHLLAAFRSYDLIIFDSATDLGFYPSQVKSLQEQSGKAMIAILQSTKDGGFKGSQEWLHDVDISLTAKDFEMVLEKSRYKTGGKKSPTKGTTIPI